MPAYFDKVQPWAFMREQTFDSVEYTPKDTRVVRACELLRDAEAAINFLQGQYGHLDGDGLKPYAERMEQEVTELIRKLKNLRNDPEKKGMFS